MTDSFCSLPFTGLYYQNNSAGPCCAMGTKLSSPKEYFSSAETIKLRQDFLNGLKPARCNNCWVKESYGMKSIRTYHNNPKKDLTKITHLELRESNLCNFSCRMCNPNDSVVIEREVKEHPTLTQFFKIEHNKPITEKNWIELLELLPDIQSINLTGGEPMLMKRYYDLLNHLIIINKQDIKLNVYTNGSVYNTKFIEKFLNFKNARLILSIDAVEKVAEYQRRGTNWNVVRNNIYQFLQLPINLMIHSTITAYSILDVLKLSEFFIELHQSNHVSKLLPFTAHIMRNPKALEITNLNIVLRSKAIDQIDLAIDNLSKIEFFNIYVKELNIARANLVDRKQCDFKAFIHMTKLLDNARNESFENTFGHKLLYIPE